MTTEKNPCCKDCIETTNALGTFECAGACPCHTVSTSETVDIVTPLIEQMDKDRPSNAQIEVARAYKEGYRQGVLEESSKCADHELQARKDEREKVTGWVKEKLAAIKDVETPWPSIPEEMMPAHKCGEADGKHVVLTSLLKALTEKP